MAATIEVANGDGRKPELLQCIKCPETEINMACIIPGECGVITAGEDRYIRVYQKRDCGTYWPSICQMLPSPVSSLKYNTETKRLFAGCHNGIIMEYQVSSDYNKMTHKRDYNAHQNRVLSVHFCLEAEWVLSASRDKYFSWHCSETGRRCGGYLTQGWGTCIEFDAGSHTAFIGDYSGAIYMLRLFNNRFENKNVLRAHHGSVRALAWDPKNSILFSASYDRSVIVWDLGGGKGVAYEMQGHNGKVLSLAWSPTTEQIISGGDDGRMMIWSMNVERQETSPWQENNNCQICQVPFFWNFSGMINGKSIGVRQHHCRKCGRAVCDSCSPEKSVYPKMGFEIEVRMCKECMREITKQDKFPLAYAHDAKHHIVHLSIDPSRKEILSVGTDRVIKIWNVGAVLV